MLLSSTFEPERISSPVVQMSPATSPIDIPKTLNSVNHGLATPPNMVYLPAAVMNSRPPTAVEPPAAKQQEHENQDLPSPPSFDADTSNETDDEPVDASPYPRYRGRSAKKTEKPTIPEPVAPHVNISMLLEAAEEANEAANEDSEEHARYMLLRATHIAQTDKYIAAAINRAQTVPSGETSVDMRPVDRRKQSLPPKWSRYGAIKSNPAMFDECKLPVRGAQGCGRDCTMRFANLVQFAKHVDESHAHGFRPYCCPSTNCPWGIIGFHERSECTRHIRTKHYKAMYACEFDGCSKIYNRSDAFRRHVRQAHGLVAKGGRGRKRLKKERDEDE